jgi:molecular chaperone GrpE
MGIEPLSLLGKPFDPNVAEAVDTTEVSDPAEDGVVLDEVTRGFTISGKLLRPARVRVGRLPVAPSVSE